MAITSDKLLNRPSELHRRYGGRIAMKEAQQKKMVGGGPSNVVLTKKSIKDIVSIKVNVIKIENILKGTLASEKKSLDEKKRRESGKRREKQEEKLETKKQAEKGPIKMPKIPRMGFLDWIKNFIGNVILGYFAIRLLDYLPKIKPIIKFLGSAADFIIDWGGKLLDGLVTFVDWGYKAIDFTRGMMKSIGGENFAKVFDGFTSAVSTLVETAIIAAAVIATQGGNDGGGPGPQRPGRGGRPQVTTSGGGAAGRPDIRNPLRQRPTVTTGQGGKPGGFRFPGTGPKVTGGGSGPKIKLPRGIKPRGGLLGLVFLIPDLISAGMLVSQGRGKDGLRTLLSAVSGVVAGMGAYGATLAGAAALGITGVGLPAAIGLAVAGLVASSAAGIAAYNLADAGLKKMGLIDRDPGTGKPYAYRSGGVTRGGKRQTGARRTIGKGTKGKYKRVVPRKPGEVEIKPGADIGGEDKIFGIFPNPLKAAQRALDVVNPFNVVKTAGEDLGKTDYFGPILAITSKITLGQKPSQKDYENVGLGINMLIAKGIRDKQLKGGVIAAFAEGGLVDPDVLSAAETGGDISNWVAKTFQGEIESNAQKTLRVIRENAQKKGQQGGIPVNDGEGGEDDNFDFGPSGGPTTISGSNEQKWKAFYAMGARAGAKYPELVAAQFALESGWGTALSGTHNYFGIKAAPGESSTTHSTKEEYNGKIVTINAGFKNFKSPQDAVNHLVNQWYKDYKGYKGVNRAADAYAAAQMLKDQSYATDSRYVRKLHDMLNRYGKIKGTPTDIGMVKTTGGVDEPSGETLPSGVKGGSLKTGPSSYIGGSTAYHIDTKFHKSLGMGNMVSAMDKLANAYDSRGRKIEFSNAGVSGAVWNSKASSAEKKSLLQRAIDAHSHSKFMRAEGFLPFDYYNPKKNDTRFGKSVEGSEILLPTFGGKVDVGTKYGGYGKSAEIFSGNKMVAMTGHGDVRYEKGGETLPYPHLAMVGEKGTEIVVDADSAGPAKDMLLAINQASGYKGVMQAIQQYAPYDALAPQTIVMESPDTSMDDDYEDSGSSGLSMAFAGAGSNPFESLYQGG